MHCRFPELFRGLEERKGELGITGYGITETTLEEVFLSATRQRSDSEEGGHAHSSLDNEHDEAPEDAADLLPSDRLCVSALPFIDPSESFGAACCAIFYENFALYQQA